MCLLEFVEPYAQEFAWRRVWPRARISVHREIRGIVADPFNRDLDDPGGRVDALYETAAGRVDCASLGATAARIEMAGGDCSELCTVQWPIARRTASTRDSVVLEGRCTSMATLATRQGGVSLIVHVQLTVGLSPPEPKPRRA
jgi:hypothetical protein